MLTSVRLLCDKGMGTSGQTLTRGGETMSVLTRKNLPRRAIFDGPSPSHALGDLFFDGETHSNF